MKFKNKCSLIVLLAAVFTILTQLAGVPIVLSPGINRLISDFNQTGYAVIDVGEPALHMFSNEAVLVPEGSTAVASFPFYDGFESGSLGGDWSTSTTNEGQVRVSTSYPYAGSYSLLLDDSINNSTTSIAAAILALDLGGQTEVDLDFWWREFEDEYNLEDGVYLSDDNGSTWERVLAFSINPTSWRHQVIDLDEAAQAHGLALNSQFQIKFQFRDNSPIPDDGFAIDEVWVQAAPAPTPASFPFYDGFESGSLGSAWMTTFTNEGRAQVSSSYPYSGTCSLLLDDWEADSIESTSAAILAVDLSGQTEVDLDFWWREFEDEYNLEDGVYLSDDNGATWERVLAFSIDPTSWRHQVIDLDEAAQANGLILNSQFQIKFQFRDNSPIPDDGFAIDEVRVQAAPVPTPASFPFYDGFESGSLGSAWMTTFTNEGRAQVSSSYPFSGTCSLLLDDWEADSIESTSAAILAVDLSGQTEVDLDFWWREFEDEYNLEDGVYLSDDNGATWERVLAFSIDPTSWRHQVIDLDEAAQAHGLTLNSQFQIKFQFRDNSPIPDDGFAIDEVRVQAAPVPTPASFPFYDGFESGSLGNAWVTTFNNEGRAQVSSSYPYAGSYSLLLDDWEADSIESTSAAILAIDLSAQSQVNLAFWWREFDEEFSTEDGVYISADGGGSWVKVYSLSASDNSWQQQIIDLDAEAQSNGLRLNDHFMIKFQFSGESDIPSDGFAIDEVQARANIGPTLSWPGDEYYEQDGLHPESGDTGDSYVYRVMYTDADADQPDFVRVNIEKGGQPITGSPFTMTCESAEYSSGVICSYSRSDLAVGDDYTYSFTAEDEKGNAASETPVQDAPDVTRSSRAYLPIVILVTGPPDAAPVLLPISNPEGHYKFTVEWGSVENASSYVLEQDALQSFSSPAVVYEGANTSTEVSVKDVGTYYFRVKASNPTGSSDWSNIESVEVSASPPGCPRSGAWAGTTDQGSPISFKVSDSPACEVESLTITVQLHYCVIVGNEIILLKVYEGAEIVDLEFEFNEQYYDARCSLSCKERVDGEFTSETEANGSWYYYICNDVSLFPGRFCFDSGTWTASYSP